MEKILIYFLYVAWLQEIWNGLTDIDWNSSFKHVAIYFITFDDFNVCHFVSL